MVENNGTFRCIKRIPEEPKGISLVIIIEKPTDIFIKNMIHLTKGIKNVKIIDASKALYPMLDECKYALYPDIEIIKFSEKEELISYIKSLNSCFLLFHVSLYPCNFNVFRAIPEIVKYIYPRVGSLPIAPHTKSDSLIMKLKRAWMAKYILISKLPFILLGIRYPDFIIYDGKKSLEGSKQWIGKNTKLINIRSYDYEIMSDIKSNSNNSIIFIDENLVFHPDYKLLESIGCHHNITENDYYPKINGLLNRIKSWSGFPVVIASHPVSTDDDLNKYNFPSIKNNTHELIYNCKFVVAHNSTAIGCAVMMRKPIIIATTNQIEESIFNSRVLRGFANELGLKVINLDSEYTLDESLLNINEEKYNEYIKNYMCHTKDKRQNGMILKEELGLC